VRQPGDESKQKHDTGRDKKGFRIIQKLAGELLAKTVFICRTGNQDTCGSRNYQGRNLGDETLSDSQQRIVGEGVHERHALLPNPDNQAAEDIYQDDNYSGDGVSAYKFTGTVHGTIEIGLPGDFHAAVLCFLISQKTGRKVRINRHLFTRHRIQSKACRYLGDTSGTFRNDDKINDYQNQEQYRTNDVTARKL